MKKISEQMDVVAAIDPQDIGTADVTGSYVAVGDYRTIMATLQTASLTAASVATVELLQATDAVGTGSKALKAAVSATAPVGNGVVKAQVEARVDELDSNGGFAYVAVKVTCNEDGKVGAATLALGDKRYS